MAKRLLIFSLLLALTGFAGVAQAQECRSGVGLGSTLLIPYFEVNLNSPAGVTTLFSVNNESQFETLVRVVLWTDFGVPTLGFDIWLRPRDLQTMNVRDLLNGIIPSTGAGEDLSAFAFCESATFTPVHSNPALTAAERATLAAFHTGTPDPTSGLCASANYFDNTARGYITVDTVDECSAIQTDDTFSPASATYFVNGGGGGGIGIVQNRLWGDFFIVNPSQDFAQGSEAIAIRGSLTEFAAANEFTFYGRYSNFDAQDERSPLPDLWANRFLEGGPFSGGTQLVVWRDTGTDEVDPFPCAGPGPSWFPLNTSFISARDEAGGNFFNPANTGTALPFATQSLPVSFLNIPYNFGRMQIALADGPGLNNHRQGWVQVLMSAENRYSLGFNGVAINSLCNVVP
ncbi:MAG: hypothetical protein AAF481_05750 [Acidobacteriota bacterium]